MLNGLDIEPNLARGMMVTDDQTASSPFNFDEI